MTNKRAWEIVYLLMNSAPVLFILFCAAFYVSVDRVSILDTRYAEKGDELHPLFVVALFKKTDDSFTLVSLSEVAKYKNMEDYYLIPKKEHERVNGRLESDYLAYDVLEKTENYSIIQTTNADDDNTVWSTYSIDSNHVITPVKTKMRYFGYMGVAMLMAFGFTLLVKLSSFIIHYFVRKKYPAKLPWQSGQG
ncbi:MAG: hypothetical protein LBU53_12775 [Zoogloeaceae bacterium]|jgi:hypothetical protein|nr:hypothetical protein [Zoogloeaceae bacterium]